MHIVDHLVGYRKIIEWREPKKTVKKKEIQEESSLLTTVHIGKEFRKKSLTKRHLPNRYKNVPIPFTYVHSSQKKEKAEDRHVRRRTERVNVVNPIIPALHLKSQLLLLHFGIWLQLTSVGFQTLSYLTRRQSDPISFAI